MFPQCHTMHHSRLKKKQFSLIVLTDNYYLFFALSQLFVNLKVIHIKIADKELDTKLNDKLNPVLVIIDNEIFMQGEWYSVLRVVSAYDLCQIVWLQERKTGSFIPLRRSKNYIIKKNSSLNDFKHSLSDIFSGDSRCAESAKCQYLTKKEHHVIKFFASEKNLQSISRYSSLSVKSIYQMRTVLMNKFGFDNAFLFQFVILKNIKILAPSFLENPENNPEVMHHTVRQ